jgi:RNA polymerase sigma-70 factor (ECF subfamily)
MNSSPTLPPEALLEHAAWLRHLAAGLVRGDGDADDLVQETWLAALRSPPREQGPARNWLGEVLRNASRMRARSAGRRARREAELGSLVEPAALSPEVLLARAEAQRRLSTLVTELAEPLRSTILLRYFEGLSAAEIARRQGVPAGTVRWRLKTGLDRLRAALDGESGGDRRRWGALLAPLAGSPDVARATAWKATSLMTRTMKVTSTMKVGVTMTAAALLVGAAGWRARTPAAEREFRGIAIAPPAFTSQPQARLARDQMRERILETLRRLDAGAASTPSREVRPTAGSTPPPDEGALGTLDPAYVKKHVREEALPLLRQCYRDALRRQPGLGGTLVYTLTVVGDSSVGGIVEDVDFADTSDVKDDELRTCARESLMTLSFDKPPAGGGSRTVVVPVHFSADGDREDSLTGSPGAIRPRIPKRR